MFEQENHIPFDELKHKGVYRIHSRNLDVGIFNEATRGFLGIREKFGSEYLFEEYHWDTGAPFGTVHALEFLELCPLDDIKTPTPELFGYLQVFDDKVKMDKMKKFHDQFPKDYERHFPDGDPFTKRFLERAKK
jgi:hypothetical protein